MTDPAASPAQVSQRPKIKNPEFINHLKAKQLLPVEFIEDLLAEFNGNALDLLMALIQTGYGSKQDLCQIWCNTIGIAHVDLEKTLFQPDVVRKLPESFAREYYAIPVYKMGDTITVATATPQNKKILKEIEIRVGGRVNLVFALPQDIEWAIEQEYMTNTSLQDFLKKIAASRVLISDKRITPEGLKQIAGEEAINQLHVAITLVGITENISEIIIEPSAEDARVYFVDHQDIKERFLLDLPVYRTLTANLIKLAKLDNTSADASQYSRILFPTPGKKYDIRVLSLPTETGQKLFLKLMDRQPLLRLPQLANLYMSKKLQQFITHQLDMANGIFLMGGPDPAAQTAIAYAILLKLASGKDKCLTVEDNIKYLLNGIEQYQVNPEAGVTRRALLESCLKQHPKMIYIQNIDDPELKDLLVGINPSDQFIVAGIKAENAVEALYRALQMGMGNVVTAVVAQQPATRLCDHCKKKYILPEKTVQELFITKEKTRVSAWREAGCAYCSHTGFIGSIGIYEYLPATSVLKDLAEKNTNRYNIHQKAKEYNYESLEYDGIKKVLRGLTPLKELERIQSRFRQ